MEIFQNKLSLQSLKHNDFLKIESVENIKIASVKLITFNINSN